MKLLHVREGWCIVHRPDGQVAVQKRRPQGGEPQVEAWEVEHELVIPPLDLAELIVPHVSPRPRVTPRPTSSKRAKQSAR